MTMEIALTSLVFVAAALLAGTMGFAIQRGATCSVAAVDEVVSKRSFYRLGSMLEASLWVVGGLLIAQAFHLLGTMPSGYAINAYTVLGGVLLGLGAYVNRACVFGAIARLGSGEWAYLVTPVGFYVGCITLRYLHDVPAARELPYGSPVLQASIWIALLFVAVMMWRLSRLLRHAFAERIWSPHAATTVIGITFLFMFLMVGAWAYTDVLSELARGMAGNLRARFLLVLALLAGAALGGWTANRFRGTPVTFTQVLRCFSGGVLMGWGSLLIPGGNDGLLLVGMPLLWPYAWVAFLTMCIVIGMAQIAQRRLVLLVAGRRAAL